MKRWKTWREIREERETKPYVVNIRGEAKIRLLDGRIVLRVIQGRVHTPSGRSESYIVFEGRERQVRLLDNPEPHGRGTHLLGYEEIPWKAD